MSKFKNKIFKIESKYYKLIRLIAEGGNAFVWEVESENKKYAIKVLKKEKDIGKKERFKNEIKFCKENRHNNLVRIYTSGEINHNLCYVMPLYEYNLSSIIEKNISVESRFDYILQICNALKFLHDKNVIHRDLKPENILIKNSNLVLADLGIAHFEDTAITKNNDLLANRGYSAPEQKIKGLSRNITRAVDIYSLGLIINEIFTNNKPEGSNYTRISDIYPWLIDIDKLVEKCLRQNPFERPSIKEVLLELKLKFNELKEELDLLKENLLADMEASDLHIDCDENIIDKIINQASNDILTAKYFFENKTAQELEEYNFNYHCNVHYKLETYLKREYMKYLIKERCKRTFLYEGGAHKYGNKYIPLNLEDNTKDKKLYENFLSFLKKNFIVDGETLKLFSSCCDYHCEEIIQDLDGIKKDADVLDDAPILYIVMQIIKIKDRLYDISLEDYILVNWEKSTLGNDYSDVYMGLFDKDYYQDKIEKILSKFVEKYNAVITKKDKGYVVRFEKYKYYNDFKNYALELSEPYYIFNGDVLDMIRIEKEYDGVVELKQWNSFDIKNVLAKIIGFKKDY